jgi:hypothetical protein
VAGPLGRLDIGVEPHHFVFGFQVSGFSECRILKPDDGSGRH